MSVSRKVEILTNDGTRVIDAFAASEDSIFVVHEKVGIYLDAWVVTHAPTGWCTTNGRTFSSKEDALKFAEAFEAACPAARGMKRSPDKLTGLIGPWKTFRKQGIAALKAYDAGNLVTP